MDDIRGSAWRAEATRGVRPVRLRFRSGLRLLQGLVRGFDRSVLTFDDREAFRALAEREGLPVQMHFVTAPLKMRRRRVSAVNRRRARPSGSK
jgi:hypothetical protein